MKDKEIAEAIKAAFNEGLNSQGYKEPWEMSDSKNLYIELTSPKIKCNVCGAKFKTNQQYIKHYKEEH